MSILVIDGGFGTPINVLRALRHVGADAHLGTGLAGHDAYVLAGVGHFGYVMDRLRDGRIDLDDLRRRVNDGARLLGICVGAQVLLDSSEEAPLGPAGLGLVPGRCVRVQGKAPRIGWYRVNGKPYYFVHSFWPGARKPAWGVMDEQGYPAIFRSGSITGVQFHPEKSGTAGLAFLREWAKAETTREGGLAPGDRSRRGGVTE